MNKKIKLIICALISAVILFFVGLIIGFAAYNIFSVNNTQNTADSASTNSISSTQQTTTVSNISNSDTDNNDVNTPSKNIVSNKTYNPNATINSNNANLYYKPDSNSEIIPGGQYLGHGRQIEVLKQNVDGTNYDEVIVTISSVPYKGYVNSQWITMGINN
ncbi:hypothetical protein [Sarcina ventriculi]|uniref:hypothetical protein n=1 Tax=Sarcina ventriculi TaxID=1267 RepID=UPI001C115F97|nr:hypothetical protein [Sarcina ventriculi]MBU5322233.1 hypothetical protein [Sarcina ventriculi]